MLALGQLRGRTRWCPSLNLAAGPAAGPNAAPDPISPEEERVAEALLW